MIWGKVSALCPGTNQVEGIFQCLSILMRRAAPTRPNSPREMALSDRARKPPIQSESASKSKVRQTVTLASIGVSLPGGFSGFVPVQRFQFFEALLQLLVLVSKLVQVLAHPRVLLGTVAALAKRGDCSACAPLDSAIEVAVGQPPQRGYRT